MRLAVVLALLVSLTVLASACGGGPRERSFTLQFDGTHLTPDLVAVKKGDRVTLTFHSPEAGVFHIHGYELGVPVEAGGKGEVTFTADATGRFPIHFHPKEEGGEGHQEGAAGYLEVRP